VILQFHFCGYGFYLRFGGYDISECEKNLFCLALFWKARGHWPTRRYKLTNPLHGGLEFSVMKRNKTQGWRLRGPVEHFEY